MPSSTAAAGQFRVPPPTNEPVRAYAPGSAERASLAAAVDRLAEGGHEALMRIGDADVASETRFTARAPHRHELALAEVHAATPQHVEQAIRAAAEAKPDWAAMSFADRAAIFLRAADLLAGPWRDTLNAATILHQSKSVVQAEIDAAVELIDFLRFNVHFAERLLAEQPLSPAGQWNRMDYRPLEGFVLALTPFNFTAIGGNLPTAPALLGNTVLWKPSEKQAFSAHFFMQLLRTAGLPDGVINLLHGDGAMVSDVAMAHPDFAGLHFTGSAAVFHDLWRKAAEHLDGYRTFPRIVGETGGKDFVVAHPSALVEPLVVALGRGAFEYQGQKCSAASRAYLPASLWPQVRDGIADLAREITVGDVGDLSTFCGAVIDRAAYERLTEAIGVDPTVLVTDDPRSDTMVRELFGPVLTVYVYDDARWSETLDLVDSTSPYGLTGAVFAQDRAAVDEAVARLRNAAGNFYINDKPTGSVVGQQPFGGARKSGTNDKAGSLLNLVRWTSPRAIKETFVPPTDWRYPHMG